MESLSTRLSPLSRSSPPSRLSPSDRLSSGEQIARNLLNFDSENEIDISINGKHCLDVAIALDDHELFTALLDKGADPFCAIKSILKNISFLEILLSKTEDGSGIESDLFPYTATRLISLRGKEKTAFHKLVLRYDFPVSTGEKWRVQTKLECYTNRNDIGAARYKSH